MPHPSTNACDHCTHSHVEQLEGRTLLAAGDPDSAFGTGGVATINFPGGAFQVNDVAIQSNGKVVAVGTKAGNLAVTRFNVNGTLDTTFGNGGLFESARRTQAVSVAIQPDDKILLTFGRIESFFNQQVGRLHANGSDFDNGFGLSGIAGVSGVLFNQCSAVAVQRDGKIVAVGSRDSGSEDFAIARYNPDGSPDTSFDDDGLVVVGFGDDEAALAVAVDYNGTTATNPFYGTIVVVGDKKSSPSAPSANFAICRLLSDGRLDNRFDSDGKMTSPDLSPQPGESATGVQIQGGGKIVVSGTALAIASSQTGDFLVARYLSGGALDATFGPFGTGVIQSDFGADERALDVAPNYVGGFLVSGGRNGGAAVAAYTPEGLLDTRFNGDGFWTGFGGASRIATSLNTVAPIRRMVLGSGNRVGRYIDVGSLAFIWEVDIGAGEAGPDTGMFQIARTEPLPTAERIFFNISGSARPPYLLNADYLISGATINHPFSGPSYVDIPANQLFVTVTLTPRQDTLVEGDEYAVFALSPTETYDVINQQPTTIAIRDDDDAGGPTVTESRFWFESAPQRLEFTFSQDVGASISDADFAITGPNRIPPHTFSYNPTSNIATLSFQGILPDGDYTARAIAAGITNGSGQPLAADHVLNFFFLNADANRDRRVNLQDFNILAANFGQSNRDFAHGDFNYDTVVGLQDFNILAGRFGAALGPDAAGRPSLGRSHGSIGMDDDDEADLLNQLLV